MFDDARGSGSARSRSGHGGRQAQAGRVPCFHGRVLALPQAVEGVLTVLVTNAGRAHIRIFSISS